MEFKKKFIPIEVIELIYEKINDYKTKKNFCLVNKITYQNFFENIENIEFYSLEINLNVNYLKFYHLLKKYNYENKDINYLKQVINKSLNFNTIWQDNHIGFIDTRYIFELMYHTDLVTKYMVKFNNKYFYKHFYKNIKQCIIKNKRQETLENIEKHNLCTVLKKNFHPKSTKNTGKWVHLQDSNK